MFTDRMQQFEKFGIPSGDVERVRAATTDMWADTPGGWVYEWSKLAESYADSRDHAKAALAYGFAKFPCLNSEARVHALGNQLDQYELAAKDFPVRFERRIIEIAYRDGNIEVPVHLYSPDGDYASRPVLIASGGVDTFKMDFHPWCLAFTMNAGVTTLAFDNPGTGESPVPLDGHADEVIRGLASYAKSMVTAGSRISACRSAATSRRCPVWPESSMLQSISAAQFRNRTSQSMWSTCPLGCTTSSATRCIGTTPRPWKS